jgi:hypothetical protein
MGPQVRQDLARVGPHLVAPVRVEPVEPGGRRPAEAPEVAANPNIHAQGPGLRLPFGQPLSISFHFHTFTYIYKTSTCLYTFLYNLLYILRSAKNVVIFLSSKENKIIILFTFRQRKNFQTKMSRFFPWENFFDRAVGEWGKGTFLIMLSNL